MKNVWRRVKEALQFYLTQECIIEVISLLIGVFVICCLTITVALFSMTILNNRGIAKEAEYVKGIHAQIAAYMASATEDEYDEIIQTIRHDLVFSEFGKEEENFIQYIPNTSENCPGCLEGYLAQACLTCTNTGEFYSLDIFEKGADTDVENGCTIVNHGYDEISGVNIHVTKQLDEKKGYAQIYRERGIVSMHKMKGTFCDDCIRDILKAVEGQPVEEVVIFDTNKKIFYPVKDGMDLQIGDYELRTAYDHGEYKIDIEYVSK